MSTGKKSAQLSIDIKRMRSQVDQEILENKIEKQKSKIQNRNEPCNCGSGKLFKKCCQHKKKETYDSTFSYTAFHQPSNKQIIIIGIDELRDKVCVYNEKAVYRLSSCINIQKRAKLTEREFHFKYHIYGKQWTE